MSTPLALLLLLCAAAFAWAMRKAHLDGEAAMRRNRLADAAQALRRDLAGPWPDAPVPPPEWRPPSPRLAAQMRMFGDLPNPYALSRQDATFVADLDGESADPVLPPPPAFLTAHQRLAWAEAGAHFARAAAAFARRNAPLLATLGARRLSLVLPHAPDAPAQAVLLGADDTVLLRSPVVRQAHWAT